MDEYRRTLLFVEGCCDDSRHAPLAPTLGYDISSTIPGRRIDRMTREEEQVARLVERAFRGVTLGNGVGLQEADGIDGYADAKKRASLRADDEQEDWSRIPGYELERSYSSLSFFDAEGLRFHLPAYILADLRGCGGHVIFHLTYVWTEHSRAKFALLNDDQREAIRQFLLLRLRDTGGDVEDPDHSLITMALEQYWASPMQRP